MRIYKWKLFLACLLLGRVYAADAGATLAFSGGSNYSLTERSDFRRYDNGKYTGLVSREVRSFITADESGGEHHYDGLFYVAEKTKRDRRSIDAGIHDAVHSEFKITRNGKLVMLEDNGYPSFRNFPSFPVETVKSGDSWKGEAVRAFDPLNKGIFTKMPMLVQYTYTGRGEFDGEEVHILKAKWATRYGKLYRDPDGDDELENAQGSHDAVIYVSVRTGYALLVRDTVDEYFEYAGGKRVQLKGTVALFTKYPPALDSGKLLPALQRAVAIAEQTGGGAAIAETDTLAGMSGGSARGALAKDSRQDGPSDGIAADSGRGTAGSRDGRAGKALPASRDDNGQGGMSGGRGAAAGSNGMSNGRAQVASAKGSRQDGPSDGMAADSGGGTTGNWDSRDRKALEASREDNGQGEMLGGRGGAAGRNGIGGNRSTQVASAKGSGQDGLSGGMAADSGGGTTGNWDSRDGEMHSASTGSNGASGKLPGNAALAVEKTASGLRLTMQNLRFKADSAELLDSEAARLDAIAEVLKQAPESQFLVEGHTASVGYPAGELRLSAERARAIAAALARRGIDADKFICRGSGATKPIADNTTREGKAKNRRVEITILE